VIVLRAAAPCRGYLRRWGSIQRHPFKREVHQTLGMTPTKYLLRGANDEILFASDSARSPLLVVFVQ